MRRSISLAFTALFSSALVLFAATPALASSSDTAAAVHVKVTLSEMSVTLDRASVPAGPVVFDITNTGGAEHEFVILKTDIAQDKLPAKADEPGKAAEFGHVDEIDPVAAGATVALAVNLSAGNYVLLCNKPGHYAAGMHAAFTVTTPIAVTLKEMSVTTSQPLMRAGDVTFTITNAGTATHELVVIKTNVPEGGLVADPAKPGQVDESGSQGEAEDIGAGNTATLTLTLAPGTYTLICNQPGHYAAGMHASFTVLPTLSRTQSADIDMALATQGFEDLADIEARTLPTALLSAPGIKATDLDRTAVADGIIPRSVASDGSLVY